MITYGSDDDEGYSITCIICWCERSIICWCDLNHIWFGCSDFIVRVLLNKITYRLDDDEGYSIKCIICWCERSTIYWCDLNHIWFGCSDHIVRVLLNKITYGLDDDEGNSITCIICWCERSIICWCDLNQGPRSHSKCLSARISERFLSSVSALKSWRQEKYNDGMKGQCSSHQVTTWSSAQEDMVSFSRRFYYHALT